PVRRQPGGLPSTVGPRILPSILSRRGRRPTHGHARRARSDLAAGEASAVVRSLQREGGVAAIAAGVVGFLYSVAFVFLARVAPGTATPTYSLLLLLGGL